MVELPSLNGRPVFETHHQDGSRSEQPGWLVLPEKGMYTGILITGATGSAKTRRRSTDSPRN